MATRPIRIQDFTGGLDTSESSTIDDNELALATNVYYNKNKILTTRNGITTFGDDITDIQHSMYFSKFSNGTRTLLMAAGTNVYEYNEGTLVWDVIKTGLTDGLRLSFVTFKDVIYWTNGTDNVMSYDGTTVAEHSGVQKGKYFVVANDIGYMGGVQSTGDRSVVFYSAANPTDFKSAFPNNEPINEDDGQVITGLTQLGATVFVGKDDSIYKLDVISTPVQINRVDYSGGVSSHRSWQNVENDIIHLSREGVFSLAQRRGTTGSYRASSLTDDVYSIIQGIKTRGNSAAIYFPEFRNYYLAVDSGDVGKNHDLLVWSVLTRSWTRYEGVNVNQFVVYEDAGGTRRLLAANSFGGQSHEIESGTDDNELSIGNIVKTKTFDFDQPEALKVYPAIDIGGFISRQASIKVTINIDGTETTKTLDGSDYAVGPAADTLELGTEPLGEDPLGGGAISPDGISVFPFVARVALYQTGRRISVKLKSDSLNSAWQFTKMNIFAEVLPTDVMEPAFIN